MKKNLLKTLAVLITTVLLFSNCKKEIEQLPIMNDVQDEQVSRPHDNDNKCQLRRVDFVNNQFLTQFYEFHYNHKGLVDKWRLDYGELDGFREFQITYDNKNRIKKADAGGDYLTFYYNGNFITHVTKHLVPSGKLIEDTYIKYDAKGQMIKQDEVLGDFHTRFFYNNKGFNTRTDYYVGNELVIESHHRFNISNRNPYFAVNGIDYGFPFPNWPLFDKRLQSQDSTIEYGADEETGGPLLVSDFDPAKTRMQTGTHNYLKHVYYYDRAADPLFSEKEITFTYQNCGDNDDDFDKTLAPSPVTKRGPLSPIDRLNKILSQPSKNIKQELKTFRKQYLGHR
jgi:hypothetical protein